MAVIENNTDKVTKLMEGVRLAHKRLVEKAKREDDTLIIERDGKPARVKARDL